MLSLVASPIGNLSDMSERAIATLRAADRIACEDTRHSLQLLNHFGIQRPLVSFHAHSDDGRLYEIADAIAGGAHIALLTDAGTPGISDPGQRLALAVVQRGATVVPIPGPCAAIVAIVASGLQCDRFHVEGFLPRAGKERAARLLAIAALDETAVIYESPHRTRETLLDLEKACGIARRGAVARELTKLHEEIVRGTLAQLAAWAAGGVRGEVSLVIGGRDRGEAAPAMDDATLLQRLRDRMDAGDSMKSAARAVAEEARVPVRRVYQLGIKNEKPENA